MDISSASLNFGIIAPEIVLLIAGMIILLIGNFLRDKAVLSYFSIAALAVALIPTIRQWNDPQSGFFGMVMIDNFAVLFNIIFITAGIITLLMARSYLVARNIEKFEFYPLVLFCTVGMMTMASSSDLVVIFLGLEIMSVPLYVMAGLARHDLESNESSIKYFIMGAFASAFLLYGIALIYGASETTDLRRIITDFDFIMMKSRTFLIPGALLVLVGFAFKVAAVPFHMWVPDVYQGAPTPVTGYFSVGPKAAGFAALLRIFIYGFPALTDLTPILWVLAVVTMSVGNLMAIFQPNIKRMLAYSSIAHAGYILVALTAGGDGAVSSALYYLTAYTFFNLGGFVIITMIDSRAGSKAQLDEMKGLSKTHPFLAAFLALFMFALAGFPPTAGFFGKFYVFSEAVRQGYIWLVIIAVMNSFVSVYYYLRVIVVSYFGKAEVDFRPVAFQPALILALFITAAGTLILGLLPGYWLELTRLCAFPFI
ncbi:MAG: NADH-quinone oxidoreductase subunit N [candidate division Zixibacteria bacterium HGW-Zixibacteria-1]|nr:MAG: NADH-quinone oxidoreductase subunit N [candidate division Zixibacteria bacterium HGW-Zixibacteria-1]